MIIPVQQGKRVAVLGQFEGKKGEGTFVELKSVQVGDASNSVRPGESAQLRKAKGHSARGRANLDTGASGISTDIPPEVIAKACPLAAAAECPSGISVQAQ